MSESRGSDQYAFSVNQNGAPRATFDVGGVPLELLIHSGSSANVVDKETWNTLKKKNINCTSRVVNGKSLQTYAADKPLVGCFNCDIQINNKQATAEFCVIEGVRNTPLLSRCTAEELGVLRIEVHAVEDTRESIMRKYPDMFQGIGKLHSRQVKLYVDENVTPIVQPLRRTPYNLRDKVKAKINWWKTRPSGHRPKRKRRDQALLGHATAQRSHQLC